MLRSLDEPFTLYGLIAQSIETDDARSFVIFRLDPRARFSDGVPVSAADVLFTFDLLKQKGRPQQRDAFGRVKRAEALDLMTVRFDLSGLDSEMPLALAIMPVLPKHGTDVEHFDDPTLKPPVGTGPYVIADVQPGKRLILRRNPDYWARDLPVQRGLFDFDEIEIDYYRDANSSFEAFKAGLCDFRQETDAGRWISSYDFPAVRDGRTVKESRPYGLPKGMEGFAFSGDLVPDPLAGDLPLELGEGQQHIEGQPSHAGRGVERLGHRDEGDAMGIERLDQLGEVGEGPADRPYRRRSRRSVSPARQ